MDDNSLVATYISKIFTGVRPGWKKILLSPELRPALNECFKQLDLYLKSKGINKKYIEKNSIDVYIRPKHMYIFEAFKYIDPANVKAIIVGQDPYLKPEEAQGLSFSVPKGITVPKSLTTIYKCLMRNGEIKKTPEHGNLINWAKQGVLLLNRFLTRSPNILHNKGEVWIDGNGDSSSEYLHEFWGELTTKLIIYLAEHYKKPYISLMLWGDKAANILPKDLNIVKKTFNVMYWKHPAAIISESDPTSFVYCDHFTRANEILVQHGMEPINWDVDYEPKIDLTDQFALIRNKANFADLFKEHLKNPNVLKYNDGTKYEENIAIAKYLKDLRSASAIITPIVACIDGACPNNASNPTGASFGVHFPKIFGGVKNGISEEPQNINIYGLIPNSVCSLSPIIWDIKCELTAARPTNNRGELFAFIQATLFIIRQYEAHKIKKPIILVADSQYLINTINVWIWNWLKEDPQLKRAKNSDLIFIIKKILDELANIVPSDKLIEPGVKAISGTPDPSKENLHWPGLTMLYQRGHLTLESKKKFRIAGGYEYDKILGNETADELCNKALKEKNETPNIEYHK